LKSSSSEKNTPAVLIAGDDALVAEYSLLAESSGYEVVPSSKMKALKPLAEKISIALELTNLDLGRKKENIVAMDKALPATTAIVTSSANLSVLNQSEWITMKHRLVGIAALPTFLQNSIVEVAPSVHTIESTVEVVRKFFASMKKETAIVQDRVGLVLPRILCQIVNEAMFAIQEDVASPKDIDTAMRLGTNYPAGPIEWGEKMGFAQVYAVLTALQNDLGEERYRVCPLLKQLATTGKFWG